MSQSDQKVIVSSNTGNETETEEIESEDDIQLKNLLRSFELEELYSVLKKARISFKNLKYLKKEDIKEVIEPVGLRAEFREKLFSYLKSENAADDDTLSSNSKINTWLDRDQLNDSPSSSQTPSFLKSQSLPPLSSVLRSSTKGSCLLTYYKRNSCFTKKQRDELIQIIMEELVEAKGIKFRPESFVKIVQEIVSIFPSEKQNKEYYYIPRHNKKNPSGRLYSKYFNMKTKRKKWDIPPRSPEEPAAKKSKVEQPERISAPEEEESMSLSLKNSLKRDCRNWSETKDRWRRTFILRQADAKKFSTQDFLLEWPILKQGRAPSLVNIDFKLLYPGKEHLLIDKWDTFKKKVFKYYDANIKNVQSKFLLIKSKNLKKIDCEDYIYAVLLNSILLPTSRYKSSDGSTKKKASIHDANESFILKVANISEYKIMVEELISKYYEPDLTMQPFIIAEGSEAENLSSFYVYFDEVLYKFDSFMESLDSCFKFFQVFNLKYPKACELPWNFIQQFFYEIYTGNDLKSSSLTSLMNAMKN